VLQAYRLQQETKRRASRHTLTQFVETKKKKNCKTEARSFKELGRHFPLKVSPLRNFTGRKKMLVCEAETSRSVVALVAVRGTCQ
jgi:succinate dehydrogenase/fumarate reductase-like Fe-S protein